MVQGERDCKSQSPKGAPLKFAKTSNGDEVAIIDTPMLEMPQAASAAASSDAPGTARELNDMVLASMHDQAGTVAKSIFKSIEGDIMGLVTKTVSDTMGTFGKKVEAVEKEVSGLSIRVGSIEEKSDRILEELAALRLGQSQAPNVNPNVPSGGGNSNGGFSGGSVPLVTNR